eukprot:gene42996-34660_t
MVMFNSRSYQHDRKYVDDASDHPFSFGARMCLGARVARLEIAVLLARLVRSWRLDLVEGQEWTARQLLFLKADPFPKFVLTAA